MSLCSRKDGAQLVGASHECEDSPCQQDDQANVFLNVYDILPRTNALLRKCCCSPRWGIYHTGVQVHGLEFSFGGCDSGTGVFCARPRSVQGAKFREQICIGSVALDALELRQSIAEVSKDWAGCSYEPFGRNCNHFSDFLCEHLTGSHAPPHINKFTRSCFVRAIFYRCLVPIGKCLERVAPQIGGVVTYTDDAELGCEASDALGISGARGMNQVLVEAASMQKQKANRQFKGGGFDEARSAYRQALGYLASMNKRLDDDDEIQVHTQAHKVRVALLLNVAACDLKLCEYENCVASCGIALGVCPESDKALYRRGVALSHLGRLPEALADLRRALELIDKADEATLRDVNKEIERTKRLVANERKKEKAFAKRMLGGASFEDKAEDVDKLGAERMNLEGRTE